MDRRQRRAVYDRNPIMQQAAVHSRAGQGMPSVGALRPAEPRSPQMRRAAAQKPVAARPTATARKLRRDAKRARRRLVSAAALGGVFLAGAVLLAFPPAAALGLAGAAAVAFLGWHK